MPRHIVYVTDCTDIAANELRAVLRRETGYRTDIVVEPAVPVSPAFSVLNANLAIRLMAEHYPPETVLMSICNGERVRASSVIGRTKERGLYFVGRNNGAWDWLTRDLGVDELYNVDRLFGADSTTSPAEFMSFAGKYVTAPIAAKVACGVPLAQLGTAVDESHIMRLNVKDGTVVHIDNFGLMKFTGNVLAGAAEGDVYKVRMNGREFQAIYGRRLMSHETGTWVVFPGSSLGLPELGMVRRSGVAALDAKVGDHLSVEGPLPRP